MTASPRSPFDDFRPEHRRPLSEHWVPRSDRATEPIPRTPATGEPDDLSPPPAADGAVEMIPPPRPHPPATTRAEAPTAVPTAATRPRRVAFVLHAHLPWVLGHGRWPHGEEWLAEAIVHCYLPLLAMLRRRREAGQRPALTVSVTPVLAAQLVDPRCSDLVEAFVGHRMRAADELADTHPLAEYWRQVFRVAGDEWRRIDGDLIGALRTLADDGVVELSTAAFSHPYLPLLHQPGFVRLQLRAAHELHTRLFGTPPRGLWMPECAYRPRGPWRHPVTGSTAAARAGNEEFLAAESIDWTVVDAHLLTAGGRRRPAGASGLTLPSSGEARRRRSDVFEPPDESDVGSDDDRTVSDDRLQPVCIGDSGVVAMVREPQTAGQVWSREGGYPGDGRYLEFHKRHATTGLRLWRVTDTAAGLGDKLPYWRQEAEVALSEHADHFVELLTRLSDLDGGVALCPFDAELFGHWWHEGPGWLEAVLQRVAEHSRLEATTPAREIDRHPPRERQSLAEGSWGAGGDHRVWVNERTDWMWHRLGAAERRVADLLDSGLGGDDPRLEAALKQLMLAAASDWPFLVTTGTAVDYAEARFRRHLERLEELLAVDGDGPTELPAWVDEDLAGVRIDPRWWEVDQDDQDDREDR